MPATAVESPGDYEPVAYLVSSEKIGQKSSRSRKARNAEVDDIFEVRAAAVKKTTVVESKV